MMLPPASVDTLPSAILITEFHDLSHQLYRQTVEGMLKPDVEKKLRQLGVRT